MHYSSIVVAAALVASTLAAPAPVAQPEADITAIAASLEARADTVLCKPKKNDSKTKTFKVDVAYAKSQGKGAGFKSGGSGYPHKFNNRDGIDWGSHACNNKNAILLEYPVYWVGSKGNRGQLAWQKNVKVNEQKPKTPMRVVYANANGGYIYCGVMIHENVADDYKGNDFFMKCT